MPLKFLDNQDGFTLVTSMLFLIVLTVIGIAATSTTSIEYTIAGNERSYKQNFYLAEGAAKESALQNLESPWVIEPNKGEAIPLIGAETDIDTLCSQVSVLNPNAKYGIIDNDIPQGILGAGHSLKVEGTGTGRMNFFDLYGQAKENDSTVNIVMGYTKRL